MNRPKVIYIAGKYRGRTPWEVEQNIRAAEEVAAKVWAAGMVALCPHANSRHMDGVASDEHFLAGTLELMRRCDAVVLVPNWRDSAGAQAEVAEADRLGIPVFGRERVRMAFNIKSPINEDAFDAMDEWVRTGKVPR